MAIDRDLHLNTIVSQDMGSPGQDCMGKNKQLGPECSLRNKKVTWCFMYECSELFLFYFLLHSCQNSILKSWQNLSSVVLLLVLR